MSNYIVNSDDLDTVADAIRQKSGSSAAMTFPEGFASQIQSIPTGSGGGYTPTVLECTVDVADATETDGGIQIDTTLTSGTYAAALAAAQAGTPAVLKITLQETAEGTTESFGAVDVFFQSMENDGISGGLQLVGSVVTVTLASDGSVCVEMSDAGGKPDVVWMSATLDLQTMMLSDLTASYDEVVAAHTAQQVVKCNINYYNPQAQQETTVAELRTLNKTSGNKYVAFDALMMANFGSGLSLYFFRFDYGPGASQQIPLQVFQVSTTSIS